MSEVCNHCGDTLHTGREHDEGQCIPCMRAERRDKIDFCMWCGQPLWRRGRACSQSCRDNLRIVNKIEAEKWDDDEIRSWREPIGYQESIRATIEDIIERKLREDHEHAPVVVPELCPDMQCWWR